MAKIYIPDITCTKPNSTYLSDLGGLGAEAREAVLQLEEELVSGDLDIPVYFAQVSRVRARQSSLTTSTFQCTSHRLVK